MFVVKKRSITVSTGSSNQSSFQLSQPYTQINFTLTIAFNDVKVLFQHEPNYCPSKIFKLTKMFLILHVPLLPSLFLPLQTTAGSFITHRSVVPKHFVTALFTFFIIILSLLWFVQSFRLRLWCSNSTFHPIPSKYLRYHQISNIKINWSLCCNPWKTISYPFHYSTALIYLPPYLLAIPVYVTSVDF